VTRRICLIGATVAAGALALSVGPAVAAKSKSHKTPPPKPTPVTAACKLNVNLVAATGQQDLTPGTDSGAQFGTTSCPAPMGSGLAHMTFTLADDGDTTGSFWQYFGDGSVHGTYDLTPSDPTTITLDSFSEVDYTGTLEITGGSGPFKPATGKGTATCTSPDSVHLSCKLTMKFSELTAPVVVTTPTSSKSKSKKG
jgi:hypothetical protein